MCDSRRWKQVKKLVASHVAIGPPLSPQAPTHPGVPLEALTHKDSRQTPSLSLVPLSQVAGHRTYASAENCDCCRRHSLDEFLNDSFWAK